MSGMPHIAPPSRPRSRNLERGVTAVEMALLLPAFVLLVFGIIEVANILRLQMTLDSAVAVMARTVSQDTTITGESGAQSYFNSHLDKLVPSVQQNKDQQDASKPPALTMSPSSKPACEETPCTPFLITINYTYTPLSPIMTPFFEGLTLSASAKRTSEPDSGTSLAN
ncbi:TadE/TadG family type IV pilus assembly protein [Solidesulfovibrio sp.]|uniref:TadE/TadG family type IV pilus assembly protein n=1 Tax=Solidesulfovibrio sp. TaxID=2910990 RepID=UPI002B21186E|nr:TadE/TadG family type IV pilus assembly protein [Solidesulfovibrio sp.]MEA5088809.1 TadE/TadG family type IV pilus assembly protein [Solidesulfovibrio sp.]